MLTEEQVHAGATRITFGFKEGLMFGLGVSVPLLVLCLVLLGVLLILP